MINTMINPMIEEIQHLHLAVHQEELDEEGFEDKYDCRLTVTTIDSIRAELLMLHHKMMQGQFGMFNANDL
jgi:hypothetical protein